jgi:cytoskeletal protein RodZ
MPHVDEGLLHAYLDGALDALAEAGALPHGITRHSIDAHLAVCADCRALLETERTIRTRAGAVLDAAAPVVDVPPFSELFAAHRTRRPRRRVWPLAWAASLLLAVGAGWWGNILFRQQSDRFAASEEVASPSSQLTAPSAESARAATASDAISGAPVVAEPTAAPAPPPAEGASARFRDAETAGRVAGLRSERAQTMDETRPVSPPAVQGGRIGAEDARVARSDDVRRGQLADTGRGNLSSRSLAAVSESASVLQRHDRAAAAAAPVPTPPPPSSAAPQRAAAADFVAAAPEQAAIQEFRQAVTALDAGGVPLTSALPTDLPLLQVDGGSAPTVERGAVLGASLARVTQRAASGAAVELILWRQRAVALNEIVVTGAARERDSAAVRNARRARTEAESAMQQKAVTDRAPFAYTRVVEASLRRRLLLRRAASGGICFRATGARRPAGRAAAGLKRTRAS